MWMRRRSGMIGSVTVITPSYAPLRGRAGSAAQIRACAPVSLLSNSLPIAFQTTSRRRDPMSVNVLYTTSATATGGRDGEAATKDGSFKVKLATPKELGGAGGPG